MSTFDPVHPQQPRAGENDPAGPLLPHADHSPQPVTPAGAAPIPPVTEPPLLPPPPAIPAAPLPEPFIFHGKAAEYFRIWIVNTLLTLLTVGVFSAWAKVRKRRYLRGCTELLGHRFDYRANPRRILVGNIIMLVLFLGYSVFGVVYPAVRYSVIGLGVVMLPWIVVRSLTFNANNTVYRGMRFRFKQSLGGSTLVFLLEPILIALTLGIYYPKWVRSKRNYIVENHRLGDAYFRFNASTGPFYAGYLLAGAMLFGAVLIAGIGIAAYLAITKTTQAPLFILIPSMVLYGLGIFTARQFIYAWLFNHIWNHTRIDEHRFTARLKIGRWLGLQFTNLGAILISAGLLYPWAVIRTQRYTAASLGLVPAGSIDTISRFGETKGSAVGDTAAEFIGLDFGL